MRIRRCCVWRRWFSRAASRVCVRRTCSSAGISGGCGGYHFPVLQRRHSRCSGLYSHNCRQNYRGGSGRMPVDFCVLSHKQPPFDRVIWFPLVRYLAELEEWYLCLISIRENVPGGYIWNFAFIVNIYPLCLICIVNLWGITKKYGWWMVLTVLKPQVQRQFDKKYILA